VTVNVAEACAGMVGEMVVAELRAANMRLFGFYAE